MQARTGMAHVTYEQIETKARDCMFIIRKLTGGFLMSCNFALRITCSNEIRGVWKDKVLAISELLAIFLGKV